MAEYYIEIPKRKIDIEFPEQVTVKRKPNKRFGFASCAKEDESFFEYWMESNGISYQEM